MTAAALDKLSIEDLQAELRKRERRVRTLHRKREKLMEQIAEIDAEIADLGGTASGAVIPPGRKRPRNDANLADALAGVLHNKTLSVTDAAHAVQQAGYATTSDNFRTIVNQTLLKDKRFKRVARGQYTATSTGKTTRKRSRKKRG